MDAANHIAGAAPLTDDVTEQIVKLAKIDFAAINKALSSCVSWMQGSVKCIDCYLWLGRDAEQLPRCAVTSQCLCYFVPVPDTQMRPCRGQAEQVLGLLLLRYVYRNTDKPFALAVLPGY